MAFWGVEVKPGKPFTQKFDDCQGRLHVSLATLGLGSAAHKSVLQCNVGNKSPIYLCSLLPTKTECLQLNLEFEESDDVVFSVIGPRSIHISGYFLGGNRHTVLNNDSESYGEDIANTDTEGSVYGDDEYEDSFINDDDPEILPPSPVSIRGKVLEKKTKSGIHRHKRLRKKYQSDESDDQGDSRHINICDVGNTIHQPESDEDDSIPISGFCKARSTVIYSSPETKGNCSRGEVYNKKAEANCHFVSEKNGKAQHVPLNDQSIGTICQNPGPSEAFQAFQSTVNKNVKKKKICKIQKKGDIMDVDVPIFPSDGKSTSDVEVGDMEERIAVSSQTRKVDGVIIEELEPGIPEGKVAVAGKKISVTYSGKLKKTGEIIESNNGGDPFKFRLGVGKVIRGWDVGINGMIVGERRRITIPPSMGFGQGHGAKVPPNSWLIYEIELIKVR